jgi:hypothetical protein
MNESLIEARSRFSVRWYQQAFHEALVGSDFDKLIAIWHRRAGKDEIVMHGFRELSRRRIGTYWHCLPEYEQARKAIWDMVVPKGEHVGKTRVEAIFPKEAGFKHDQQKMMVHMPWGSTWQLIGSDNYNATVGAGPVGIGYSEWALSNPSAYAYHKPMLLETKGKAAFISTPRGNNHCKTMLDSAQANPGEWFSEVLNAIDTKALTAEELADELRDYQALYGIDFGQSYFEQEYLCSFSGAAVGAYFGAEMAKAEREGRICDVPVDENYPVHTVWDLGKAVNNPIWCFQVVHSQLRIVDFYIPESDDIEEWVKWLNDKGYRGLDYVPHDIVVTEWGSKRTRFETLVLLGRKPVRVAKVSVADGLQAGRGAINSAVFDVHATEHGREGLKAYRREWDDELKTFKENPVKDWAEHIGSAWRYLGLAWREVKPPVVVEKNPEPKAPPGHVLLHMPGPPKPREGGRIRL